MSFEPALYTEKTTELVDIIRAKSSADIAELMRIKGKLLNETVHAYDAYPEAPMNHGVAAYCGIVFQEINWKAYDPLQLDYLHHHLRILSALYGVLTPFTGIKPYRLDMTMKPDGIDLYKYWREAVTEHFQAEDIIVNLASLEFSKMITKKGINGKMLNIHFKEEQSDGRLKVVTVRAKKARGLMVDFMTTHMVEDVQELKKFDEMGYCYDDALSGEWDYVFVKRME